MGVAHGHSMLKDYETAPVGQHAGSDSASIASLGYFLCHESDLSSLVTQCRGTTNARGSIDKNINFSNQF